MDKLTSVTPTAKTGGVPGPRPQGHPAVVPERDGSGYGTPHLGAEEPPRERETRPGVGVYVHFPWCIKKCPYCDFLSVPSARQDIPHREYADAVIGELAARREELGELPLRSVFFGGGTPSLWHPAELGRVLSAVLGSFATAPGGPEVTVECNPGSLNGNAARALLDAGVNRLSIGVQGLDDERLRFLGRWHGADQALAAVQAALASGMPRVSADLIYGVAGQSPLEAAEEARRLAGLGVTHLSAYTLTIEPQTAFGALARKGRLPRAPEDSVAEAFLAVDAALAEAGFEHYEISNFAREGHVAEHNLGYWRGQDYVGLGCGAWGTVALGGQRVRYRNRPQPRAYMDAALDAGAGRLESCRALESEHEVLSADTRLSEALMLGLRLAEGLDIAEALARTGASTWSRERERSVQRLTERGVLERRGSRLRIPKHAWLLADGVIAELL